MSNPSSGEPRTARLTVSQFWRLYAGQKLVSLGRNRQKGYNGSFVDEGDEPPGLLTGPQVQFQIVRADLLQFDYGKSVRFGIGVYPTIAAALAAVIGANKMEQDYTPNRYQLRLAAHLLGQADASLDGDYAALRKGILDQLKTADIATQKAVDLLAELQPTEADYQLFEQTRRLETIRAERELLLKAFALCFTDESICKALRSLIDNQQNDDMDVVLLAIWALARQNDKKSIDYLLSLLQKADYKGYTVAVERALQLICSGSEMIPLAEENEYAHWSRHCREAQKSPAGWALRDAESVFWEKRLRCATEWTALGQHPGELALLRSDEVKPVRVAAGGPEQLSA